jgi:hypothetical protein
MKYYKTAEEREGFIDRMKRHFNKEKIVIEKTLERLESLERKKGDNLRLRHHSILVSKTKSKI